MKALLFASLAIASLSALAADVYVSPHVTKSGTYVQGHYRSAPDGNKQNNYDTAGNANPYTGKVGTTNPSPEPTYKQPPAYQQPKQTCVKDVYGKCF